MHVDFFIVGAQKAGTTALYRALREHPQVQMATVKEVHHFDDETVDWEAPDHSRLESFFDWSQPNRLRGEATPIYLYWPDSLRRLQLYNTKARVIVGLRHPSFRAFSHWRMETQRGRETLSFSDAISWEGRKRVHGAPNGAHRAFSYVERSFYYGQILSLLTFFPRHQTFFYRTDQLWDDPGRILGEVQTFLNLDMMFPQLRRRYLVSVAASNLGKLVDPARSRLDEMFREDIRATEMLTQMNLSDWMSGSYEETIGSGQ